MAGDVTAEMLVGAIIRALEAHDVAAVAELLRVLAGVDAVRAEQVYQALSVGLGIAAGQ